MADGVRGLVLRRLPHREAVIAAVVRDPADPIEQVTLTDPATVGTVALRPGLVGLRLGQIDRGGIVDRRGDVLWLRLNRPDRMNAYDRAMVDGIITALQDHIDARVGVITGTGRAFCAGGYLANLAEPDFWDLRAMFTGSLMLFDAIRTSPFPVIAAVNGGAFGGGNELVVACDLAIAAESAKLGQTGVKVGSAPVLGGTNLLAASIGEKRAKEVSVLLRSDVASFIVVSSPRAEAIGEAEHLIGALRDGSFPFAGVVVNLIHPMPEPLTAADRVALDDLDEGPLADQVAWHDELTELATAERDEIAGLADVAEDVIVVELPLLAVDVHDVDGLVGLAEQLAADA